MALGSLSAMAHDSMIKYGIAISHDGEQIAYGKSGSGETALIFIHGWSLDSRLWQNQVSEFSKQYQVITVVALAKDVKSAISSDRQKTKGLALRGFFRSRNEC
ncbi:conserved hypothetical protein [Vibrio chagasii]|nr:conserved hypothetical protein [Vibrio chagasii]CAH7299802.1 conserved hypothetical protein [Vibrio chagasii]CAH7369924.1 conserved hypothetical protein [Vibrio chagasii]CAH7389298.1 conserved hypothetical protein [Vibrio chagasii]